MSAGMSKRPTLRSTVAKHFYYEAGCEGMDPEEYERVQELLHIAFFNFLFEVAELDEVLVEEWADDWPWGDHTPDHPLPEPLVAWWDEHAPRWRDGGILVPTAHPTVADVIAALKALPQDSPIYFDHPDTNESTWEWHFFGIFDQAHQ